MDSYEIASYRANQKTLFFILTAKNYLLFASVYCKVKIKRNRSTTVTLFQKVDKIMVFYKVQQVGLTGCY